MASSSRLYRNFIILQEDERGYANSNDKSLSGYAKIEAKGDICKISFYAQNLRKDEEKYNMMLICDKKDSKQIVDLGKLDVSISGKADYTKEYNVDNIAGIDLPLEKISGAAIGKYKNGVLVFVMCGFLNGQQPSDDWKNYKVIKAKSDKEIDKKIQCKEVKKDDKKDEKKEDKKHDKKDKKDKCEEREIENKQEIEETKTEEVTENISEENRETVPEENIDKENIDKEKREEIIEEILEEAPKENLRGKFEEYEESIEENKEFDPRSSKIRGTIGEYFEAIADGFKEDVGYDELKYCKWYKVPVSDLYEMCNMSNYNKYTLVYYPMLNYYPYIKKHGYFKLGYKCDSKGNLKYIIYAIPGKKDKDEQPYDGRTGFVTWITNGSEDDIGCWLMFYDFKNSTVVVPMQ